VRAPLVGGGAVAHGGIVTAGHALGYVSVSVRVRVGWRGFGRVREYRPALLLWLRALVMHPNRGSDDAIRGENGSLLAF